MTTEPNSPTTAKAARGRTWAVLAVAVFLAAPWPSYVSRQVVTDFRIMDRSWQYDLPWEFAQGRVVGRDYVFNYGVLYQLLHALPLLVNRDNPAALVRFHDLPEVALSILAAWLMLATTAASWRVRATLFAVWVLLLVAPEDFHAGHLKPMAGFSLAVACGWLLGAQCGATTPGWSRWTWAVWCFTPPIVALYSLEFGLVACAALLGTTILAGLLGVRASGVRATRLRRQAVLSSMLAVVGLGTLLAMFLAVPALKHYLPNWLQLARHYAVAKSVSVDWWKLAALAVAGASLIGLMWLLTLRLRRSLTDATAENSTPLAADLALLAAVVFALLWLRYALVRGGISHFYRGMIPTVFTWGCLVPARLWAIARDENDENNEAWPKWLAGGTSDRTMWLTAGLLLVWLGPFTATHAFRAGWIVRAAAVQRFDPRPAELLVQGDPLIEVVTAARDVPGSTLFVWPYEVLVNVLANKANPTFTLQSTSAHTEQLQRAIVERLLRHDPPVPALVYRSSLPVDGVAHITRSSAQFRELLLHYELAAPPGKHHAILRPTERPRPWQVVPQAMPAHRVFFNPGGHRTTSLALHGVAASDLLVLKLRVARTPMWLIGKPGFLLCRLMLSDGTARDRLLLVPYDGEPHEVLVSATTIADPCFFSHFVPERRWRSTERIERLMLTWQPMDPLSRRPDEVELIEVARLECPVAETLETALADQQNKAVRTWCYSGGPRP